MSYFVTVTFDLNNEDSTTYTKVDNALESIGLSKRVKGSTGKYHDLPANTYVGEFEGESTGKVRDDVCAQVQETLKNEGVKATAFITVGSGWAWGIRYT